LQLNPGADPIRDFIWQKGEDGLPWMSHWNEERLGPKEAGMEAAWVLATQMSNEAARPVLPDISDRQFAQGLWKQGVITLDEAKAFVKVGTIPAAMQALINTMPVEVRDDVELLVSGATELKRRHPFSEALASSFGWTQQQTDDFWRFAGGL